MTDSVRFIEGNGDKVIVAFTGRNPKNTHAEWSNYLKDYYSTLISFNDVNARWYLDSHWRDTITSTVQKFPSIDLSIGLSMGGFAAIYYQDIINAKQVRAFGSQSFVNPEIWKTHGRNHGKWASAFEEQIDVVVPDNVYDNVKVAFGYNEEDAIHETNFIEKGYEVVKVKTKSHSVVPGLKRSNTLLTYIFS